MSDAAGNDGSPIDSSAADWAGKVAVVTGGASGIGLGLCQRFAQAGLDVVVADIEGAAAARVAAEIQATGARTLAVQTDVSDAASVAALADAAFDWGTGVHVLCNNAGVFLGGPTLDATEGDWRWLIDVNLMGVVHGCRSFLPRMIEQGTGHVVNTASTAGLISGPGFGVYSATKFAVVGLSQALRAELAPHGIGVIVLCPGSVRSQLPDADRNRPERYGESGGNTDRLREVVSEGMDPLKVGDLVLQGMADGVPFLNTHRWFRDPIAGRFEESLASFDHAPEA
jgi:NAD(P)-dependent dehydrogenase (short-subunit alcohol dehydrogenase family)